MIAARYDITIDRASDYRFVLTIQNQGGGAVSLTNEAVGMAVTGTLTSNGTTPVVFPVLPYVGIFRGKPGFSLDHDNSVSSVTFEESNKWVLSFKEGTAEWTSTANVASPELVPAGAWDAVTNPHAWKPVSPATGTPVVAAVAVKLTVTGTLTSDGTTPVVFDPFEFDRILLGRPEYLMIGPDLVAIRPLDPVGWEILDEERSGAGWTSTANVASSELVPTGAWNAVTNPDAWKPVSPATGTPVVTDLDTGTPAQFAGDIRDVTTKKEIVSFTPTILDGGNNGQVLFTLTETQTLLFNAAGSYEYDIFMVRNSVTTRLLYGTVTIRQNFTKGVPIDPTS
jgi:hypothetical protein